jgi:Flp pilus assembly pilin Flp
MSTASGHRPVNAVYDRRSGALSRLAPGLAWRDRTPFGQRRFDPQGLMTFLRRLHRDESGATTTEYILILALIVLPIGLMFPMFMGMVKTYGGRMTSMMGLPFP